MLEDLEGVILGELGDRLNGRQRSLGALAGVVGGLLLAAQRPGVQRVELLACSPAADRERLLDAEERMVIDMQMEELRELMKGDDGPAIELQTKRLSQVTDAFAARRLDSTVKAALSGRNLNEIEE